ncbi:MAG TPA: zinc-binding dehydrogenase [Candidatus Eisenbacteria bacterium]|jgi:NADPH:quinone reductase-like Zn-dependent oxidoreductase
MKAMLFERHGGPEVLELREVPDPKIAADEVLLQVKACGMNHLDLWVRDGSLGLEIEMPHALGSDVVGVALETGAGVRHVKPGDKILVLPTLSCGSCRQCLAGDDNLCRHYDLVGRRRNGGYAEKLAVPGRNCLPYPDGLPWEQAAAIPVVFLTAWHMLVGRAKLRPGEDCLVIGGSSGVGSAAVQIARLLGARVIATVGGAPKLEQVRSLGAHEMIDHSKHNVGEEARRLTGKKGVEVVFEHVGGQVFEQSVAALARNGRLVTCGATAGHRARLDLNVLFGRHLNLLGSWMGRKSELLEVLEFVQSGALKPVVDSVYPLADARPAHQRLQSREQFGKLVLVP